MTVDSITTTQDAFLDGRLTLMQPQKGPRTAIDAFFLAAAAPVQPGRNETVLDAGCGHGPVALALCARVSDVEVTGIEIQAPLVSLANRNAEANTNADRFKAIEGDVCQVDTLQSLRDASFDHVVANPPFNDARSSRASDYPAIARAHSLEPGMLEKWCAFLVSALKTGGSLTIIYRADGVQDLLNCLTDQLGGVRLFPLFPKKGKPAKRIILQGFKGSRAPLEMLPGLVLHKADGAYTSEAEHILRHAGALDLGNDRPT